MKYEIFFLKRHAEKEVQRLVTDPFIKNQTGAYLSIGSRKIAPEENCPPALILMLMLNQTLTLTGGQFSGHQCSHSTPSCKVQRTNNIYVQQNINMHLKSKS